MFETPINFKTKIIKENFVLEYINLTEICQGGPEVGNIVVNDQKFENYFGGPILYNAECIYIPAYLRKGFGYKFKLSKISLSNLNIKYIGSFRNLIYLEKIENNQVFFYEDVYKQKKRTMSI